MKFLFLYLAITLCEPVNFHLVHFSGVECCIRSLFDVPSSVNTAKSRYFNGFVVCLFVWGGAVVIDPLILFCLQNNEISPFTSPFTSK